LLLNKADLKTVSKEIKNFLQVGLKKESFLSGEVLEQEDEIVFHFVFWEKNQAQERLLFMVEDVPPSRLKRLEQLWKDSVRVTKRGDPEDSTEEEEYGHSGHTTLAAAISTIVTTITSLAGKNEGDTHILKDLLLDIIGKLLRGDDINVHTVKNFVTLRLQGLFANSDWVAKYGALSMRRLQCIVDFFYRVNER
jgi:CRISPR-associated protein Csh1